MKQKNRKKIVRIGLTGPGGGGRHPLPKKTKQKKPKKQQCNVRLEKRKKQS